MLGRLDTNSMYPQSRSRVRFVRDSRWGIVAAVVEVWVVRCFLRGQSCVDVTFCVVLKGRTTG